MHPPRAARHACSCPLHGHTGLRPLAPRWRRPWARSLDFRHGLSRDRIDHATGGIGGEVEGECLGLRMIPLEPDCVSGRFISATSCFDALQLTLISSGLSESSLKKQEEMVARMRISFHLVSRNPLNGFKLNISSSNWPPFCASFLHKQGRWI
jgi:hypothetical protein